MRACFPHNQFQSSTTMSVYGGVEVFNEQSFCVKYRSQGYRLRFTSHPFCFRLPGKYNSPRGHKKLQGMREQISLMLQRNAISEISPDTPGFYSNTFMQGSWRVASSYRLKTTEPPHRRSSLSHAHHKLSSEYRQKRRLHVQNRSAGCVLSCTNTSTQQEVPSFCLRKQGISVSSTSLQSEHCPSGIYLPKTEWQLTSIIKEYR